MKKTKYLSVIWAVIFFVPNPAFSEGAQPVPEQNNGQYIPVTAAKETLSSDEPKRLAPLSPRERFDQQASVSVSLDPKPPVESDLSYEELLASLDMSAEKKQELNGYVQALREEVVSFAAHSGSAEYSVKTVQFEEIQKAMDVLAEFAEKNSKREEIIQLISSAIKDIFQRIETKALAGEAESKTRVLIQSNSHEMIMAETFRQNKPQESGTSERALSPAEYENTVRQTDKIFDMVLNALRERAVNSEIPAMTRAVYRSWYLSLSKKMRDMRLNRLRAMVARQRKADSAGAAL